jgi:CheY-like chemotaxis protein
MNMGEQTRILIVEDDPDGQAVVAHVLEYLRYEIDVAGDVDEALAFLAEHAQDYRAAIIDLALPGRDGWELLTEIKAEPATEQLPCIAVTAFHSSKTREDALLAGFTAYFSKPIEATSFARQLEAIV